ncbi:hypothetical protein HHK36_028323 [Tetracentron sinense]|uniref:MULE transposase domain-containing protein n=1 Tax=Tetracentron sinense TaxID=13715 RepID=A0A834YJ71_TETSI|nr:hypothetical protein HHK36_028323 [Tetracentron sinense]
MVYSLWHLQLLSLRIKIHGSIFFLIATHIVGGANKEFVILSNRQKGLMAALANIFPESHHSFCLRHMADNAHKELKSILAMAAIGHRVVSAYEYCENWFLGSTYRDTYIDVMHPIADEILLHGDEDEHRLQWLLHENKENPSQYTRAGEPFDRDEAVQGKRLQEI